MVGTETHKKSDAFQEIDKLGPDRSKFWQIDTLKVFAMILVIMDHSIPHELLHEIGSPYWQRIAIPLFLIIVGFNWSKSLEKNKDKSLKQLYSWHTYFKKKILRFILPFGVIYALSLIFWIILRAVPEYYLMDVIYYDDPMLRLVLFLPVWGPGNWFIPLLFLTILIFPLLYKAFNKQPVITLIGCFLFEFVWYLLIYMLRIYWADRNYVPVGLWNYYNTLTIMRCTPFRSLSAIGLGMWLSRDYRWDSPRNIMIWILGVVSGIYLYFYTFRDFRIQLFVGDYHMFHYPWSAMLVLIALNIFPKEPLGKNYRFISLLSKSTYHILMVQIFYFSIIYNLFLPMFGDYPIWASVGGSNYWLNYLWYYPLNVVITFSLGTFWYQLEQKYIWTRKQRIDKGRLELAKKRGWIS